MSETRGAETRGAETRGAETGGAGTRRSRRRGLRRRPEGGWPLDDVLVGVATLRTLRELWLQGQEMPGSPARAWDLALWNGVSVQGSSNSLERLHRNGLVRHCRFGGRGTARAYELCGGNSLTHALSDLFAAERVVILQERRRERQGDPASPRGASAPSASVSVPPSPLRSS